MTCLEFQRFLWAPPRAGGVINNPDRALSDDRLRTSGLEKAFPLHLLRLSLTPSDILITGEVSLPELINDRERKILWRKPWQTAQCQGRGRGRKGGGGKGGPIVTGLKTKPSVYRVWSVKIIHSFIYSFIFRKKFILVGSWVCLGNTGNEAGIHPERDSS